MFQNSNTSYDRLSNIGALNSHNRTLMRTADSTDIGVAVSRSGEKKATTLELIVPTRRSTKGSRRATFIELNGQQARDLYETLRSFYSEAR